MIVETFSDLRLVELLLGFILIVIGVIIYIDYRRLLLTLIMLAIGGFLLYDIAIHGVTA